MTSKEALEILVKQANERKLSNKIVANGIAVSLLEKLVERDTPMIPISESIELICPKCGEEQHTNTARFCSECGQRLDWSSNLR